MKTAYKYNYVKINKKELELAPSQTLQVWQARLENASLKRQKQYEYKMKKNIAHSIKWDVIRKKRGELEELHQLALQKIKRANIWVRHVLQYLTISKAQQMIIERVNAKVKWMKFIFMLNMFKFKMKRKLKKQRDTTQQRMIQRFRQLATFTSQGLEKRCESRAHKTFKRYLELSGLITAVNTSVTRFYEGA
jgi:hypothetical protein